MMGKKSPAFKRLTRAVLACALAALTAGAPRFALAQETVITLNLVGDCAVADQYRYRGRETSFTARVSALGMEYPFSLVQERFAADDLTIANCEGVLTERPLGKGGKEMALSAPPRFAEVFRAGGVDVVNLANNHSRDFGDAGLEDTMAALDAAGVRHFGVGRPAIMEVKGLLVGLCGYCYPLTDAKMKFYREAIEALRAAGCDLIIASAHSGREDCPTPNAEQLKRFPELIDMGADLVYGHGAHRLQPVQRYKDGLILYGLGNFTFGANPRPADDDTAVLSVSYRVGADGAPALEKLEAIPMKAHDDGDYRPFPIEDEEGKRRVYEKLVFTREKHPESNLGEEFAKTGICIFDGGAEKKGKHGNAKNVCKSTFLPIAKRLKLSYTVRR